MKQSSRILCLSAETRINTPSGVNRIDFIEPGMDILGYDALSGACIADSVGKIARSFHNRCAIVVFDNGSILKLTVDHPLFVQGKGWCVVCLNEERCTYGVSVDKLNVGDICVFYLDGEIAQTEVVSIEIKACSEDFYCFSTNKSHSFFANGVLVRDVDIDSIPQEQLIANQVVVK